MTGEKAKVKNFDILHFVADNAWLSTSEAIEKAYNAGVSEQKTVLDKIRAEIEERKTYDEYTGESILAVEFKDDVLDIIDKYKAESEDWE